MRLALFTHMSWPEGVNQTSVFHDSVEQVKLAESMGYHKTWFAEHHFTGGLPQEEVIKSMKLFEKKVIPLFKKLKVSLSFRTISST